MTDKQPEALRLADELEMWTLGEPAAAELRRLHSLNAELLEVLKLARLMLIAHGETHAKIDAAIAKAEGKQ